ncbi:RpiB/LacA/LacB family sugar-phosphate isomerase [Candidatus Nesciobacter abundans]|uniref:RpiB/LacA/LacB family sugar-phosphate isomerase n=1 Tax=Candidatus Nesciobacter abundans TaxID=2601668 RepID=A0A5C0UH07_9PROT|nr:RpiB/LacA/LacB family sugar-phosphate isomerase [Candidatus Nesciobacter abundans]QEK39010.1 RpiB/LacA/LacB family sugar-phosphate isomerase [Candidatus Nesciobacter abundans]
MSENKSVKMNQPIYILLGCDHRGFELKEKIKQYLIEIQNADQHKYQESARQQAQNEKSESNKINVIYKIVDLGCNGEKCDFTDIVEKMILKWKNLSLEIPQKEIYINEVNDELINENNLHYKHHKANYSVRGILICGSGIGMSIAANRHKMIRAGLCKNIQDVSSAREHNDINVLVIGAENKNDSEKEMVRKFLNHEFSNKLKYINRINKMS